jgi:ribonuclease HII
MALKLFHTEGLLEAGCDEAGRGCLSGPVVAAAVILPPGFDCKELNDSKKLSEKQRDELRIYIESEALAWAVASVSETEIDQINILNASILAMQKAVAQLHIQPQALLIDGNRFKPYASIPHHCIIKGDAIYAPISAASVLAKTHRDAIMTKLDAAYPQYSWSENKGYPTLAHREAIRQHGACKYHRKSFRLLPQGVQTKLFE